VPVVRPQKTDGNARYFVDPLCQVITGPTLASENQMQALGGYAKLFRHLGYCQIIFFYVLF
jgi:hypothetical protein